MRSAWATLAVVVVLVGAWHFTRPASAPSGAGGSLDDLMMDLQLLPLDGQAAKAFDLPSLDGRRVALAELSGKPALLYFWATW